jgi:glycosyltransferase involved in cell wall biosynthesis
MNPTPSPNFRRADLHCHSDASNKTGEKMLEAISCPECYSRPEDVYAQALRRGMDFVTITDHDSIKGVCRITQMPGVVVGEEVTVRFPEDGCKIHLLVYGHTQQQHDDIQELAGDVYDVAMYLREHEIAHSVAHPIYRQNDMLERWHLERLLLIFKGFEVLNGSHAGSHRQAFEPLLDSLDAAEMDRLAAVHELEPMWPEPHVKSRTAGSDDHGQLNVGRTFTQFPPDVETVNDVLDALRTGRTTVGGEAGSVAKLAHQFYGVAARYYVRERAGDEAASASLSTRLIRSLVGEARPPTKREFAALWLKSRAKRLRRGDYLPWRKQPKQGMALLRESFFKSVKHRLADHPELWDAANAKLPPIGEHAAFFQFASGVNRDVTAAMTDAMKEAATSGKFGALFEDVGAFLGQQFFLLPYYFALSHQNKERRLLPQITRHGRPTDAEHLRVGLFTDTLDEVNGVGRFIRDMADHGRRAGRHFTVHTCTDAPRFDIANRVNFTPLLSHDMPLYEGLPLNLPPVIEVLEHADRQQFDVIHISTPGPMGLVGYLAARMLRVPAVMTYHTDFPAYLHDLTGGDHRIVNATRGYMAWLYGEAATVLSRSTAYHWNLEDLGLPRAKLGDIEPGIDTDKFGPHRRDPSALAHLPHADKKHSLLYVGRVSVEKNLPLLAEAFRELVAGRNDVRLVVAGDGPYRAQMAQELADTPAAFLGEVGDELLGPLYAGSDLFVFPSRTDTLGQVVMEAQASGLPALVSATGGPREIIEEHVTGEVCPALEPARWTEAIAALLDDPAKLPAMSRAAIARRGKWSLAHTFDGFWQHHVNAATPAGDTAPTVERPVAV